MISRLVVGSRRREGAHIEVVVVSTQAVEEKVSVDLERKESQQIKL